MSTSRRILAGIIFVLLTGIGRRSRAQSPEGVRIAWKESGLASLRYGGREFLKDGAFHVVSAKLETLEGRSVPETLGNGRRSVDPATRTVTWSYSWGRASCRYQASANRLDLILRIENES